MKIRLSEKIGKGYDDFWHFKGRYLVVKGSRGSKKSTTAAMKIIYMMMKYPLSNTIVLRLVFNTHRDSTWKQLNWATQNLGVDHLWTFTLSPLEATYNPTGQKIYFRGCDNSVSITSITVNVGTITYLWVEEAYQIENEDDFNKVDMSMRGELPSGYFKQCIFTFNPWSEKTWLKARFFDTPNTENKLAMTTTYRCNEWLGADDIAIFEDMKKNNPQRFRVEGDGQWGMDPTGLVFLNWMIEEFDPLELARQGLEHRCGCDFGYVDPTSIIPSLYDKKAGKIYVYDEFYKTGVQLDKVYLAMVDMKLTKTKIFMDSSEPRSIDYFKRKGIPAYPCIKGAGSVKSRIAFLLNHLIIIHPKCKNVIMEFENFSYERNKDGELRESYTHEFSHSIDALGYAYSDIYTKGGLRTIDKSVLGL